MLCPNCSMNIKDDASFCIHCGTRFENNSYTAPQIQTNTSVQNNVGVQNNFGMQPQQPKKEIDRDPYMRAYFGKRYTNIIETKFSWGTFFFEWFWYFFHRMYGIGFKFIFSIIGVSILSSLVSFLVKLLLALLGVTQGIAPSILLLAIELVFLFVYVDISIGYCKNFSVYYLDKATEDIDDILKLTEDESERMKLCEKKGKPNLIIIAVFVLFFVWLIGSIFFGIFAIQDKSKKEKFYDTATYLVDKVDTSFSKGEVICKSDRTSDVFDLSSKDIKDGVYFVPLSSSSNWESALPDFPITGDSYINYRSLDGKKDTPWNADIYAVVSITYNDKKSTLPNYGIVMMDSKKHGIFIRSRYQNMLHEENPDIIKMEKISDSIYTGYHECKIKD